MYKYGAFLYLENKLWQIKKNNIRADQKWKEDYSQWYLDIVEAAGLAENSSVRGCMIIKPWGYAIWENFQKELDRMIKETGHVNAYFPMFIPKSFFDKEAEHVEGFAKESAVITHHRLKLNEETHKLQVDPEAKLEEELVVRPTSETIIYDSYSRWIKSYRDLPLLLNQWANVVRWELRTRPFLRTAEFLWQEGHTAHATFEEADSHARKMLSVYQRFAEDYLAIASIPGTKSESEKFAGAYSTYTLESMMQDGKALQVCTSHNLGDHFAKAFDIQFQDKDGELKYVWQTSWGLSTRMIGALIMVHSDDFGLVLPPRIAPIQAIIVGIWKNDEEKEIVLNKAKEIEANFKSNNIITKIDDRDFLTPGERFFEWEKKGVPVRIEIGPKDILNESVVLVRRDTREKSQVKISDLSNHLKNVLDQIQQSLFEKSKDFLKKNIYIVNSYEELKDVVENKNGFALALWDGEKESEEKVKEETKATIRCLPFDQQENISGNCVVSGKTAKYRAIFAKAY